MRKLIEIFAEQKVFGDLLTIAIIGLGLYSLFTIRREVFPTVEFDIIQVTTDFPGATPEETELLVTSPLEQELKEIDGVKKMTSNSVEGRSMILLELDVNNTDVEKAKSDVRDVVDKFVAELPEGAERSTVKSLETRQNPVIEVSVSGDLPTLELRKTARLIEKELERIRGVAGVDLMGVEDREVQVQVDPARLAQYRLSLEEIIAALKRQNVSVPGGTIEGTENVAFKEMAVRTSGQFLTVQDVARTVVRANELGTPILVSHVATVKEGLARPKLISHTDGIPSIRLTVRQKEKTDTIDLVDAIQARLAELKPKMAKGIELKLVNDASEYVRRRLGILFGNFTIGFSMVLLLLPIFLPFRFALLVGVGEPFALLGTVLVFQMADQGLNLISVIGLILVSGILVDDGIVVVENVARLIKEKGMSPKQAAIVGAQQVWVPVVASAATTIVAFVPMATMSGIFGKFVKFIPLGVIVPILISLFENFFIMPHHIGTWLRAKDFEDNRQGIFGRIRSRTDHWWENWAMPSYLKVLRLFLRIRYVLLFVLVPALLAGAITLAVLGMKIILFPPEGVEIFMVRLDASPGTGLEGTEKLIRRCEAEIAKLPKEEVKDTLTLVGMQAQDPHDPNTKRGSEFAQVMVFLTPENERERTAQQIIDALREKIGVPPGAERVSFERVNPGPPVGKPVSIGIRGEEYADLMAAAQSLKALLREIRGVTDIVDTYVVGKRQVNVNVDYEEAAAAGLSVGSIGSTVRAAYEGVVATTIRTLDEEVDVRVSLEPEERTSRRAIQSLRVLNPQGALVPLSAVSKLSESQDIALRHHEGNQREVRVLGEVDTHFISARQANDRVRQALPMLREKHPNVSWHFGGEDQDTQESLESLARAFVLAIIGIFLILVLTFRTLFQPLVVLITIPLGLISVILTFFFHGMPLSFLGMVGMVGLSGIIANNAIVFVEFVNSARKEGLDRWQSIEEAARKRAKPIFLTTITTVIAILPTAYGIGGLDKFVVPIAMSMGWGLTIGSLLTLFILPTALAVLDDAGGMATRLIQRGKIE